MKIRDQLIVFFSIIIITSIGITSFFALSFTESGVIEAEIAKMKTENKRVMADIETLHARASEDLVFALKNPKFVEYFELPESKSGNVYDENGVLQFSEKQRVIKQELEQWIYHFQNKFDVDETCLIDTSGQEHTRLVLTRIESDKNLSPDEESTPFFEPTFRKQKDTVHVQYPYVSPDTKRWVFSYSSPVELGNGQKPAIFHFEMPISIFQNLLHVDNGRMYVIDPAGYIVADSAGTIADKVVSYEPENQFPAFQAAFASGGLVLDEMKSNTIGDGVYTADGEDRYFVYERLSTFDWILVYEKPASLILVGSNSIADLESTISLVTLAIIVMGLVGIMFISTRVSRPIHKLSEQISSENPERLEELKTPNHEVGIISNSVNKLIKKMTKYQEEINLQNQELMIQKQQLERLARIGELASRLTHNLRTPLTVIKLNADLLKITSKHSLDEKSLKKLDRIKSASENLEKQIEEVLTYVRNKPLDLKNISFDVLLELTLANIEIPEKIQIITPKNKNELNCDSNKMQVVLMNIISNAIDALDREGTITINLFSTNVENIIEIADDGP
ncbi:MAG: histidine kinase dimerization/phospho-acceptor domain-containing protein, partial [Nitrosopumilus sp.]